MTCVPPRSHEFRPMALMHTTSDTPAKGSESELSEAEQATNGSSTSSILDRLRAPNPSDSARIRKVAVNHPPCGKRSCKSASLSTATVKPQQRDTEFPGKQLTVLNR